MKILNIGATGQVGRLTTQYAAHAGYEVTAFGRSAADLSPEPRVMPFVGDVMKPEDVERAMANQDAVVLTFGAPLTLDTIIHEPNLCEVGTRNVVTAMTQQGVSRLICMTMIGVGDSKGHGRLLFRSAIRPLMLGRVAKDRERQENLVRASSLTWTIVRPTELSEGEELDSGDLRVFEDLSGVTAKTIPRANVARFLVDKITDDSSHLRTYLITR